MLLLFNSSFSLAIILFISFFLSFFLFLSIRAFISQITNRKKCFYLHMCFLSTYFICIQTMKLYTPCLFLNCLNFIFSVVKTGTNFSFLAKIIRSSPGFIFRRKKKIPFLSLVLYFWNHRNWWKDNIDIEKL